MKRLNYILALLCIFISGSLFAKPDIEIVKQRVVAEILKPPVDDAVVSKLIQSTKEDGSWSGLNYENLSRLGFENRFHLINMEVLSLAYQKRSSSFYHRTKVLELVNRSLKFWCDRDFLSQNWYHNQVFTPTKLVNVLLLMDDHIEPGLKAKALNIIGRAHMNAPGARPGGDRIKFGGILSQDE